MFCHPLWLEDSCLPSHPTSSGLKPRLPLDTPGSFLNSVGGIHSCVQKNQTARNIWTYPPHPPSLSLSSAQPCYYFHSSKHFHQVSVHPCYGIPWSGSIALSLQLSDLSLQWHTTHYTQIWKRHQQTEHWRESEEMEKPRGRKRDKRTLEEGQCAWQTGKEKKVDRGKNSLVSAVYPDFPGHINTEVAGESNCESHGSS